MSIRPTVTSTGIYAIDVVSDRAGGLFRPHKQSYISIQACLISIFGPFNTLLLFMLTGRCLETDRHSGTEIRRRASGAAGTLSVLGRQCFACDLEDLGKGRIGILRVPQQPQTDGSVFTEDWEEAHMRINPPLTNR